MAEIITMPKLGFDMAEGTLVRWIKPEGEKVAKGDILAEIETDKATVEVEASHEGVIYRHLVAQGSAVPVGTPIAVIAAEGEQVAEDDIPSAGKQVAPTTEKGKEKEPSPKEEPAGSESRQEESTVASDERLRASPLARRMALEHNIDLSQIQGSGPGGRIVREDVEAYRKAGKPKAPARTTPEAEEKIAIPLTPPDWKAVKAPPDERIPLNRLRAAIGRRMLESHQQVPHFYVTHDYDFEALVAMRKQLNVALPNGERLSINDFIIKATALALRRYPNLNASIDKDTILRHGHVNISVAVSVEGGLLTVVCRDADAKPLRLISNEVRAMVERARQGRVRPEEIEGSTFSISNLGMFDVEDFVAIINPPEAAILAVGSLRQTAVVVDGALRVGTRLKATLSADHRITDGAEAAQFLQALGEYLENPALLLL